MIFHLFLMITYSCDIIQKTVLLGDILVEINNRDITCEDFSDIIAFLDMLRCDFIFAF